MATYKTPGVYVEEISTIPPSVAEVSTAIPAFIGCTANGPILDDGHVVPIVKRISTLLEFENLFGGPNPSNFTVASGTLPLQASDVTRDKPGFDYLLYYCLSLYFNNGGGSCYIISIGNYATLPTKQQFLDGLATLEKEDEPTLILLTEAVNLDSDEYYEICQQALTQCNKLGDRFAIIDVKDGNIDIFRDNQPDKTGIGSDNLMYGAAYHPYLQTSLNFAYTEDRVQIKTAQTSKTQSKWTKTFGSIIVRYSGSEGNSPVVQITKGDADNPLTIEVNGPPDAKLKIKDAEGKTSAQVLSVWANKADKVGFDIVANQDDQSGIIQMTGSSVEPLDLVTITPNSTDSNLGNLNNSKSGFYNTALYNQVKAALAQQRVVLPPSGAVAGVYASVDRDRGVWKAPANVSLSGVIGPVKKITQEEQENLNIDPNAGKSINAIRAFTGKGTLVWGARTLAGNDNEWRYVSVRRLFNMIEESAQKSTAFAVFEPNDATTWLKVKAMIESYLYGLWQQGALAGSTPDAAYFVNVGLGKSMTPQDVLEGRMIVEVGIAAVRPAEFIILRFSHKMQQA
jgi:phage tail sheath protein FI